MVRFMKIRPMRASFEVSTISGSPIAASNRSCAVAYINGSSRQAFRYSASDISVSRVSSKLRVKSEKISSTGCIGRSIVKGDDSAVACHAHVAMQDGCYHRQNLGRYLRVFAQ